MSILEVLLCKTHKATLNIFYAHIGRIVAAYKRE